MPLPIIPGGQGYGMDTRAANGGSIAPVILRVTNLNETGAGSLRVACDSEGGAALPPRVVVFETSGTIDLNFSDILIRDPYITIAGQTAPSPGITIKNGGIHAYSHDILIQHIRIRPGDGGPVLPQTADHDASEVYANFGAGTVYNVIYDHVSLSWGGGKNTLVLTYGNANTTYWRCIDSEALYHAANVIVSPGQPSSLGLIVGGLSPYVSMIGCLFAHNSDRNPEIHEGAIAQFINNVVYDWGTDTTAYSWATFIYAPAAGPVLMDIIGNKYIGGNGPTPFAPLYAVGVWTAETGTQLYIADNLIDSTLQTVQPYFQNTVDYRVGSPTQSGVTILAASEVQAFVLANAGARPLDRDAVDDRIVADVVALTGTVISSQNDVGGWPVLAVNTAAFVAPSNPNDVTASGYTNLEVTLQAAAAALEPGSSIVYPTTVYVDPATGNDSNLGTITAPFATPTFAASTMSAGSTLYFRAGTYTGATSVLDGAIYSVPTGTNFTTGAVTFAAYPGETVVLKPGTGTGNIIDLPTQQYVIVNGLILDGTGMGTNSVGLNVSGTGGHIRFQHGEIRNCSGSGVFNTGTVGDLQILSNHIHHNGHLSEQTNNIGITNGNGNTIRGNTIDYGAHFGILTYESSTNVIEMNRIYENCLAGAGSAEIGIAGTGADHLVADNFIYSSTALGSGVLVEFVGAITNVKIYNNTIVHDAAIRIGSQATGTLINSNIIRNGANTAAGTISDAGTGTVLTTNTTDDPLFGSLSTFVLAPFSPAIGTGTTLADVPVDYYGVEQPTPADAGAVVFVPPPPLPTTTTIGTTTPPEPPVGSTYTVPVTITPTSGASVPTGTVTVNDGVGNTGTAPVVGGVATIPMTAPASAQTVTLTVTFSGNPAPFAPSNDTAPVVISSPSGPIPSPPTNITFGTAFDIGPLAGYGAYTATQDFLDSGSLVQAVYYSYVPVEGDDMLEVYGYGQASPLFTPETTIWSGPVGSETQISLAATSTPMQQDIVTNVVPGQPVFFKFRRTTGDTGLSSILTIRIARGQKEAIATGDLFINDSSPGYQGITMSPTTAIPKRYQLNYPAGEGQQVLTNGVIGLIDAFEAEGVILYNVAVDGLTVRATATMPDTHYTEALACNQIDTFWAFKRFGITNSFAVAIDADGTVGTPLDLGSTNIHEGAPQADNSALYCIDGSEIKKITNPGGVRTTFKTVDATFDFGNNVFMMTDDTLLIPYTKAATTSYIRRFNLAGTEQTGSPYSLTGVTGLALERIFGAVDDPTHFWIWWQTATLNKFQKYKVSDGSLVTSLSRMKFVEGVSEEGVVIGSTIYSGADFSCVPIVMRQLAPETPPPQTMRRMRRFLLPSSPDNHYMQIPTLELLMRTGIGLTRGPEDDPNQGENPQVMLRYSVDGGKSWSNERWRSAGYLGTYLARVRWLQATGRYRNALVEVTVTDPVDWQLLAMMGDPKEGKH